MKISEDYNRYYSEQSFWEKLKRFGKKAGLKVVYPALLLYQLVTDASVDPKTRFYIGAGLGYFILPIDLIPDFAPLLGFSDDISVLMMTLNRVRKNINDTHRSKARSMLERWFGHVAPEKLSDIEKLR